MGFFCKEKKKPDRRVAVVIATVQPCFSPVPRFFFFFLSHGNRKGKKKITPSFIYVLCYSTNKYNILFNCVIFGEQ